MDGPDLDALFGPDDGEAAVESQVLQVHPALKTAVEQLAAEAWPQARSDLCSESAAGYGPSASKELKAPLPASVAREVDLALGALGREAWSECSLAAGTARACAWAALLRDKAWQRPCDKELFMLVELLLALCAQASGDALGAVVHADGAFIFAPAGAFRTCALLFVQLLDDGLRAARASSQAAKRISACFPDVLRQHPSSRAAPSWSGARPLRRLQEAPGAAELKALLAERRPLVIPGELAAWPARRHWASLDYLDTVAGHRLVPTEVGSDVGGETWKEELTSLGKFLREHVAPSCEGYEAGRDAGTAYLAQHELLEQCPALRADISVPSCWQQVLGTPSRCNIWMGTKSTLTPAHWDSYDNFLTQVQGFKRVVLLAPEMRNHLYVDEVVKEGTSAQGNVSPVNVEEPDLVRFPEFGKAEALWVDLEPGDALYMPHGWWHQVRALSPSISVNFWY